MAQELSYPEPCSKCNGTGYLIEEDKATGTTHARKCDCSISTLRRGLLSEANIPPLYQSASMENYKHSSDNPITAKRQATIMLHLNRYLRTYLENKPAGLLFIGDPGVGKTHLAVAVLREVVMRYHVNGLFLDYQELIRAIQRSYNRAESTEDDRGILDKATSVPMLVIDDIGAQRPTDWQIDIMTHLFTTRANYNRPTIVTTNLVESRGEKAMTMPMAVPGTEGKRYDLRRSLDEVIGARAASRLYETCRVINFGGIEDYRMKNAIRV